jgi:hypothetical protein
MTASQLRLRPPPAVRPGWRRLCLSTFALAAITAGLARFPARGQAPGRTGLAGRPVPVEQDDPGPVLLLLAGQLGEPFQARGR